MSWWHRHLWVETSRRFNSPPATVDHTGFITDEQVMELAYGVTVVELRCDGCGDLKAVRYAGNAEARR